ncbi:ATP-binding cassette domain-containing protein, partial [Leptospira santarosai]|nr:ATP-binding cassette domain-containing protein [Leptospira santarosai]
SGSIHINGHEVKMINPRISQGYGVSFIHQELNVVSDLRVYENMFLGSEIRNKIGFLNEEEMCKQTSEILSKLGVDINPKEYVRNLDTSYKQLIEISKSLLHKSTLIIMDEPTSSLAEHEVDRLFELMNSLKKSGVSIIYISHKLKEIKKVCDCYTVLRDGEVVGTGRMENQSLETITKLMVGKSISDERFVQEHAFGPVILDVNNLTS